MNFIDKDNFQTIALQSQISKHFVLPLDFLANATGINLETRSKFSREV